MYKVYIHRHKESGKVYVGCTKRTPAKRFENGNGYVRCVRFHEAIQEYGWDAFEHIIIQDGLGRDEALALEEQLVDEYNATNPEYGYNMRRGGKHNIPCAEVGRHISAAKMGHEVSEATRAKLREYGKRPVLQMTRDGVPIQVYPSLTEAAIAVNAKKPNIYAVCAGKKPTCRNYKWAYYGG